MPRPGPRPYECVRRAWHSDRHQPIRGSLIQEIFRVVNGIHSSATKKNKEWQEKLPIVVLKAEEIMYSKANSEAEYMDVKTLWDRTNDAINTIIRREESTETGELLQPCIEAALILGCTARRASRSQRNNNPRCYLSSGAQEAAPAPARAPDNVTHVGSASLPPSHPGNSTSAPRFMPNYSATARPTTMNPTQLRLDSSTHVTNNANPTSHGFPFAVANFPNQVIALDGQRSVEGGRSYPLYYGAITHHQNTDSQLIFRRPQGSTSATTVPAMPQVQSVVEPIEKGFLENLFISDGAINASNRNPRGDLMGGTQYLPKVDCDLSLRLGREVEDIESSSSQEGSEFRNRPPRTTKEFCFFPRDSGDQPVESSNLISRDEGLNLEGPSRKRKAPVDNLVEAFKEGSKVMNILRSRGKEEKFAPGGTLLFISLSNRKSPHVGSFTSLQEEIFNSRGIEGDKEWYKYTKLAINTRREGWKEDKGDGKAEVKQRSGVPEKGR